MRWIGEASQVKMEPHQNEPQGPMSRQRILDAALELFAGRGFDGASIKRISEAADVPPGLIYYYFESKQGLLETLVDERPFLLKLRGALEPSSAEDPISALTAIGLRLHETVKQEEEMVRILFRGRHPSGTVADRRREVCDEGLRRVASYVHGAIEAGRLPPVNVEVLSRLFLFSVMFAIVFEEPEDPKSFVEQSIDILLGGLTLEAEDARSGLERQVEEMRGCRAPRCAGRRGNLPVLRDDGKEDEMKGQHEMAEGWLHGGMAGRVEKYVDKARARRPASSVREQKLGMSIFPAKILLATDASEDVALAARAVADLSNNTGAELHVVHVWEADFPRAYAMTVPHSLIDWCEQKAAELLAKQVEHIEEAGGKVAEGHLVRGRPVDVILDLCEQLGSVLVVMGSRGLGPVGRILIGSVSEGVVHHSSHPVLVVRGGAWAWPPHRVVIGQDFSDDASAAGDLAAVIGKHYGAQGVLVRTYPEIVPRSQLPKDQREDYDRLIDNLLDSEKRALKERAAELGRLLGQRPEAEVALGEAAATILKTAGDEKSTLVAVGSRGLGAVGRARLGSVSTKVLRAARGPVLVYPHLRD